MKTKVAAIIFAAFAGTSMTNTASAEASAMTVNAGLIHFSGSVTNGPCAVQASGRTRVIDLAQVKNTSLLVPGEPAGQVRMFHVALNDCNISVYTNAQVSFSGQTDATFKSVLVNQAANEPANNVGLQLYGPDGKKIVPDDSSAITLSDGINVIPLTVDYMPVGIHPTAGNVTSTVTFNIIYS